MGGDGKVWRGREGPGEGKGQEGGEGPERKGKVCGEAKVWSIGRQGEGFERRGEFG